ncbi:MAG: hypothetical protein GY797_38360 [Deltaproteobacteria bacterium]|nr:hypothetical protein [Deltaproteobacteria bacterium]
MEKCTGNNWQELGNVIYKIMNSKRLKKHIRPLSWVTLAWILFWIAGLPDYYQQYSTKFMVIFDILIFPPIWFIVYFSAKHAQQNRGLSAGLWLSFYITIPLFIYDLIYCGFYLGYGTSFLWKYWYVTVYYIVPWMVFPLTGWWIDKRNKLSELNAKSTFLKSFHKINKADVEKTAELGF